MSTAPAAKTPGRTRPGPITYTRRSAEVSSAGNAAHSISITNWLDRIKKGYGARFSLAFEERGYEDIADIHATSGIKLALLTAIVRSGGGHAPQYARIQSAASSAGFISKLRSDVEEYLDGVCFPGYGHRFSDAFCEAGYEAVSDCT
eukprot:gene19513-34549_t